MTDVKKNPKRGQPPQVDYESFTPEYVRINREPIIMDYDRASFNRGRANNKLKHVESAPPPAIPTAPVVEDDTFSWPIIEEPTIEEDNKMHDAKYFLVNANDFSDILGAGSLDDVKNFLIEILEKTEYSAENFAILKKLDLKVGIFVEE